MGIHFENKHQVAKYFSIPSPPVVGPFQRARLFLDVRRHTRIQTILYIQTLHFSLDDVGVYLCDSIDSMRSHDAQMRHVNPLASIFFDQRHLPQFVHVFWKQSCDSLQNTGTCLVYGTGIKATCYSSGCDYVHFIGPASKKRKRRQMTWPDGGFPPNSLH